MIKQHWMIFGKLINIFYRGNVLYLDKIIRFAKYDKRIQYIQNLTSYDILYLGFFLKML